MQADLVSVVKSWSKGNEIHLGSHVDMKKGSLSQSGLSQKNRTFPYKLPSVIAEGREAYMLRMVRINHLSELTGLGQ